MKLDIVFVDRPSDDPLIQNTLWNQLDQIATLDSSERAVLNQQGVLVGVSGAIPPRPLQRLLDMKTEIVDFADSSRKKSLTGHSIIRRSGGEIVIPASTEIPEIRLKLKGKKEKSYKKATCKFRVQIERLQDGWAKLHFTPEIHYGRFDLRPVATTAGWDSHYSQHIEIFREHEFSLTLNVGEMIVIGKKSGSENVLGASFFQSLQGDLAELNQRVIVVRLADMQKIETLF